MLMFHTLSSEDLIKGAGGGLECFSRIREDLAGAQAGVSTSEGVRAWLGGLSMSGGVHPAGTLEASLTRLQGCRGETSSDVAGWEREPAMGRSELARVGKGTLREKWTTGDPCHHPELGSALSDPHHQAPVALWDQEQKGKNGRTPQHP